MSYTGLMYYLFVDASVGFLNIDSVEERFFLGKAKKVDREK